MKGFLRTAAATVKVTVADPAKNKKEIINRMREAADDGVKLLVLPELCVTGYTCQDLFRQDRLIAGAMDALKEITESSRGLDMLIALGHPLSAGNKLYNCISFIFEGEILAIVPKLNIPNYNEFYELRHFAPGPERAVWVKVFGKKVPFGADILIACDNIPGLVIAGEICEDLWVPAPPSNSHAIHGATVIVNASASNETVAKADYRRALVANQSARTVSAYVYASAGDGESTQDLIFSGHDIISENGSILAESKRFTDEMIVADIDILRLTADRSRVNTYPAGSFFNGEHSEDSGDGYVRTTYSYKNPLEKFSRSFFRTPFVPGDRAGRDSRCEEILTMQALGLKKRLEHIGSRTAVVGISGGLDSTLALLVTVRAFDMLGADRSGIIGITMPCFGTSERTNHNSKSLMSALGVTAREIPIADAVRQHLSDIGHDESDRDVTYENAQARERTKVLMDVANDSGGLVVGTGDMSELALGWCTYNGDHMAMYGVNAGVPKTLVKYLVGYYADNDESAKAVLYDILDTPISPELIPPDASGNITQKTEDKIGPYELHDFFLYYVLRFGFEPERICGMAGIAFEGVYDKETILKWLKTFYRRFFSQQFKRSCLPDGPKVGSIALSPRGDLRMPSDASSALWLKELEDL